MIKRFCILFTAILTGLVFLSVGALVMAGTAAPDKVIEIEYKYGKKKDRNEAAPFDHKVHNALKCTECHHVYKDGKNEWKEGDDVHKCAECHDIKKTTKKDGMKVIKLNSAFHRNCKNCHKTLKKEGNKKVPVGCTGCHKKRK